MVQSVWMHFPWEYALACFSSVLGTRPKDLCWGDGRLSWIGSVLFSSISQLQCSFSKPPVYLPSLPRASPSAWILRLTLQVFRRHWTGSLPVGVPEAGGLRGARGTRSMGRVVCPMGGKLLRSPSLEVWIWEWGYLMNPTLGTNPADWEAVHSHLRREREPILGIMTSFRIHLAALCLVMDEPPFCPSRCPAAFLTSRMVSTLCLHFII